MAIEIIVPQLGMMQTEALLVEWLRQEGDRVSAGDPVAIVETDKTDVEIEAPADGLLVAQSLSAGSSAPVGTVIAYIVAPGEAHPVPPAAAIADSRSADVAPDSPTPMSRPVADRKAPEVGEGQLAAPVARRLAHELGIDLSTIVGSGPGGRITEADVRAVIPAGDSPGDVERPLSRARKVTAERTARSFSTVPHMYLETTVNASSLIARTGHGVTITDLVLSATARSLRAHPELNCAYGDGTTVQFASVNIGLAVDTTDGLYVPVLSDVDSFEIEDLSKARAALVDRARSSQLEARDLIDATFTVTNLGVFDVDAAWPIINPPGVGILAVGRIRDEIAATNEGFETLPKMRLVLAADHRAVDGAQAARFLGRLKNVLETWGEIT